MSDRLTIKLGTNTEQFERDFFPPSTRVRAQMNDDAWSAITAIKVDELHEELTLIEVFGENLQRMVDDMFKEVPKFIINSFGTSEETLSEDETHKRVKCRLQSCSSLQREIFISIVQWSIAQHQCKRITLDQHQSQLDECLDTLRATFGEMQEQLELILRCHKSEIIFPYISLNFDWQDISEDPEAFVQKLLSGDDAIKSLLRSWNSLDFIPEYAKTDYQVAIQTIKSDTFIQIFPFDNLFEFVTVWEKHARLFDFLDLFDETLCEQAPFNQQQALLRYCLAQVRSCCDNIQEGGRAEHVPEKEKTLAYEAALLQALSELLTSINLICRGKGLSMHFMDITTPDNKVEKQGPLHQIVSSYAALSKSTRQHYRPHILVGGNPLSGKADAPVQNNAVRQILELCVIDSEDDQQTREQKKQHLEAFNQIFCDEYNDAGNDKLLVERINMRVKKRYFKSHDPDRYAEYIKNVQQFSEAFHAKKELAPRKPQSILVESVESLLKLDRRYQRWEFVEFLISNYDAWTPEEFITALGFVRNQIHNLLTPTVACCESTMHLLSIIEDCMDTFRDKLNVIPNAKSWQWVCFEFRSGMYKQKESSVMFADGRAETYEKKLDSVEFTINLLHKQCHSENSLKQPQ